MLVIEKFGTWYIFKWDWGVLFWTACLASISRNVLVWWLQIVENIIQLFAALVFDVFKAFISGSKRKNAQTNGSASNFIPRILH